MAHAKPIVASRIDGIPELVGHSRTGLLLEPKNTRQLSSHIRMLLDDSDLRKKIGGEARRIAETEYFTRETGSSAALALPESCCTSSSGSPADAVTFFFTVITTMRPVSLPAE